MNPQNLVRGKIYFLCSLLTDQLHIPLINTYVYVGEEKNPEVAGYIFKEATLKVVCDIHKISLPKYMCEDNTEKERTIIIPEKNMELIRELKDMENLISRMMKDPLVKRYI
ncbi:MAG: hypothetical protein AB7S78_00630 [Candidatus Omnitrophota bacterium]